MDRSRLSGLDSRPLTSSSPRTVEKDRLLHLIPRLAGQRILVLGDVVLDQYVVGKPVRISREAPVLVLEHSEEFFRPGSASNPAANIKALGGIPVLVGIIGQDPAADLLRLELARAGISSEYLVVDPTRATATKTRLLAEHVAGRRQHVLRLDRLATGPLSPAVQKALVERLADAASQADAFLVSDYKAGVVCPETIQAVLRLSQQTGKIVTVDTQGDLLRFRDFTVVKSNQADAEATLGYRIQGEDGFREAGLKLQRELSAQMVVITRGADGLSLLDSDGVHHHVPALRTEVSDVAGAGDTVIAVFTQALVAGATPLEAAHLANAAAGVVVRRMGVATVTPDELREAVAGTWEQSLESTMRAMPESQGGSRARSQVGP